MRGALPEDSPPHPFRQSFPRSEESSGPKASWLGPTCRRKGRVLLHDSLGGEVHAFEVPRWTWFSLIHVTDCQQAGPILRFYKGPARAFFLVH